MSAAIEKAWSAWTNGDVPDAKNLATGLSATAEGQHLLFLCAFVEGNYEEALLHYPAIPASYTRYGELDGPVLQAYVHLSRYAEAECFARGRKVNEILLNTLAIRNAQPLKVSLEALTEIPFAEHPLSEYFPAFEAEIQGKKVLVHLDTGGTFLHMGPDRARQLGIELAPGGEGQLATERVETYNGTARSFRLGDALLENVPVVAVPSLVGQQDFIIFGTNLLQEFLSTVDYLNKRLLLSPRSDPMLTRKHLAMFPKVGVQVPFYMWGDHYMFARGGVGDHQDLNFFIDSGLVSLHPDGSGGLRQAAFWATAKDLNEWGIDPDEVRKGVFECPLSLSLGPLEHTGMLFLGKEKIPVRSLGGVRIDGLLSHAFLKNYAWTLDFDQQKYYFHR